MSFKKWFKIIFQRKKSKLSCYSRQRILSEIVWGALTPNSVDSFMSKHADLIKGLNSSNSKERLLSLGVLINSMWADDPEEQAVAIKLAASVLKHSDINMVQKAAGGLCELGALGVRYLNMVATEPQLKEVARSAILIRAKMSANPYRIFDLTWDNLVDQAQKVVSEALKEVKYHRFSSFFIGTLSCGSFTLRYLFEIDLSRTIDMQCLLSFTYVKSHLRVKDEDCIPVVKAFAQNAPYHENLVLPRRSAIRYFCLGIDVDKGMETKC